MVTAEEFIRTWQTAGSVQEVAEKCGMTENRVRNRASWYRSYGIPLKKFPRGVRKRLDYSALAALAKSLEQGKRP